MYQQAVKNDYLDKVVEMLDRLTQDVLTMREAATVKTETLIWHEGLKLRKVAREAREGDYVRPTVEDGSLKSKTIYGPVVFDKGMFPTVEDGIYVFWGARTPFTVEVFEEVQEIRLSASDLVCSVLIASFFSSLSEDKATKEVSKLKLQSAETMAQVSDESYEKFKQEALESEHFKKLIKGIEESAEDGKKLSFFKINEDEDLRILDVFIEQLTQAGYSVQHEFPDKYTLRVKWGNRK